MFPTLLPFLLFAFVASITPGPTNILVLSNSARYGFKAALPIVLGACAGAAGIVLLVGCGVGQSLAHWPRVQAAMQWLGVAWLSYLSWQIFSAPAESIDPAAVQKTPGPGRRRQPATGQPQDLDDGPGGGERVCRQWR